MLSEEALDRFATKLTERYETLNSYLIKKISEQIVDIGELTPSQLREIMQSVKYGNDLDEIVFKISQFTDKSEEDIYKIFEEVAKQNQEYARQFYEYRNIKFIPYKENKELQTLVRALAAQTNETFMNIAKSGAFAIKTAKGIEYTELSKVYQKITDEAILTAITGRDTYTSTMEQTLLEMASKGIQKVDYATGYHMNMESAVRMNVMDGIRQLEDTLQEQFGKEFGADGVEVVHHINPAPDHSSNIKSGWFDIDGKQFSIRDFNNINDMLNRPVGVMNCYHYKLPIILGVSKPLYSEEELRQDKENNLKGFDFEDKHYTNYEGTQLQRQIERQIRKLKDKKIVSDTMLDFEKSGLFEKKIKQLTNKYYQLSKISGLPTKVERLNIYRKNIKG